MRIGCVGDNCIDYYDETDRAFPGGNPVNVAVYVRRLGGCASYVGAAGTDAYGALLLNALQEKGIDVSHVHVQPGSTAISHVTMRDGDRVFGEYDEGVMADFEPTEEDIDFLCGHDLVAAALWGHAEQAFEAIHSRGVPTAFDAAERPFSRPAQIAVPHTTLFFFSDDESEEAALREKLQMLHAQGPEVVIATRGSKGSLVYDGTDFYTYGIVPCEVVDTMGAGDSYIAGFLMAWLEKQPIQVCMEAGARNSAVTISYSGAWK